MGAGVSAGVSNDELIDNLVEADYIKTALIERVFRAVDRGNYTLPDPELNPYRDVAWKANNFHISAPCIYSEVMEGLQLKAGLSFLNLGSGTGYLNTMVGLILGHQGINHGIELHGDVVSYAQKKLEEFKLNSGAMDEYDFCEPKFIQGNCLCISNDHYLYDRVYCGAACPDEYLDFIRSLVKIGGILIVPFNERLVEMERKSETNWNIRSLLPVSFASLIVPPRGTTDEVHLLEIQPLSLQELCRACIRNLIRKTIDKEHPKITKPNSSTARTSSSKKKRINRRDTTIKRPRNGTTRTTMLNRDGIIDDFIFLISGRSLPRSSLNNDNDNETSDNESNNETNNDDDSNNEQDKLQVEYDQQESGPRQIRVYGTTADDDSDDEFNVQIRQMRGVFVDILKTYNNTTESQTNDNSTPSTSSNTIIYTKMESCEENDQNHPNSNDINSNSNSNISDCGIKRTSSDRDNNNHNDDNDDDDNNDVKNGEVWLNPQLEKHESDTSDDDCDSTIINGKSKVRRLNSHYTDEEIDEKLIIQNDCLKVYKSPYTDYMKEKIKELPLPFILKKFVNFYRDL